MTEDEPLRPYFSPQDVEAEVKRHFDEAGGGLSDYSSSLREVISGMDGEYEIDVVAGFLALGVRMRVLIECKHHRRPVSRDVVALLVHKVQSSGSQKGVVVSTSGFQSGALEVADKHGVALLHLKAGGFARIREAQHTPIQALPPYLLESVLPATLQSWLAQ